MIANKSFVTTIYNPSENYFTILFELETHKLGTLNHGIDNDR